MNKLSLTMMRKFEAKEHNKQVNDKKKKKEGTKARNLLGLG